MTEPQLWVLIGVFAAAFFSMLTWQTISFNRTVTLVADRLDAKIDGLREATNARFDTIDSKIDNLDRDVQALTRHVFGTGPR